MRPLLALLALATLAACGVDGAPEPPATKSGVSISGDARMGAVGRL